MSPPHDDLRTSSPAWPVVRFPEAESTNDLARHCVLEPTDPEGIPLVIRADRQTKGRGRGANVWWSDPGSLTFSVLLDPASRGLDDRHTPLSSLATAVAVVEASLPWIDRGTIMLRWPNDVEIDRKKVAGILPERVNGPRGARLIIGIGLNVRTLLDSAPQDVQRLAGSLQQFRDREALGEDDQEVIFGSLLARLDANLSLLASDDPGLARRWAELDQLRGEPVRVDLSGEVVEGIGDGIGPDGGLRIRSGDSVRTLFGGRVLRGDD